VKIEALAAQLEGLRWKGSDRFIARCPVCQSTPDHRQPKLSGREGEKGILLKCWRGCLLDNICTALGILVKDLFYDSDHALSRDEIRQQQRQRARRNHLRHLEYRQRGTQIDAIREAERFLATAKGIDISQWSPQQLDEEMGRWEGKNRDPKERQIF